MVYIKHKLLESTHTATLKTKWKYGEKDVIFEGENKRDDFFVAEGEYVDFELNIGSEIRIKSCESTDATHNVLPLKGETRKVRLKANEDFALTVNLRLRDDSMVHVKWNKYRDATTSVGYTGGKIIYYDDDGDTSQHSATGIDV